MKKITPYLLQIVLSIFLLSCAQFSWAELSVEIKRTAVEYRDKGLEAQKNGDMDTALVYYQKAMELDPTMAAAYNDAGVVYEIKGWNDRAKQAYAKAIELDPTIVGPYYNMGVIYEKEGDLEKAAYFFKQRVLMGDWNDEWTDKARQELKALGVSDPEIQKDFLDQQMGRLEGENDINAEPRGNDLDPRTRKRNARLHLMRAKQLRSMGRIDEAVMEAGIAITLDGKNKEIKKTLENIQREIIAKQ
jgi:tetratricopeptide (TPR) repeat protein